MSITVEEIEQERRNELWRQAGIDSLTTGVPQVTVYERLLRGEWDKIPNPWGGA